MNAQHAPSIIDSLANMNLGMLEIEVNEDMKLNPDLESKIIAQINKVLNADTLTKSYSLNAEIKIIKAVDSFIKAKIRKMKEDKLEQPIEVEVYTMLKVAIPRLDGYATYLKKKSVLSTVERYPRLANAGASLSWLEKNKTRFEMELTKHPEDAVYFKKDAIAFHLSTKF